MAVTPQLLDKAKRALDRHSWQEGLEHLQAAESERPLDGPALELLAEAAYWTGSLNDQLAAFERAYEYYLEHGNPRRAALMAMLIGRWYGNHAQAATANGWRARATSLLENEPECVEHGEPKLRQAQLALNAGEAGRALELATEAAEIGQKFQDRALWALAIHLRGQSLLRRGSIAEGLELIDEATAAAVGSELPAYETGLVYCWTIAACRDLADYSRASEWTDAADRWCERQSISGFPGVCQIHRAELMRLRGALTHATSEISRACEQMPKYNPRMAGMAFNELGEIRLRAGDFDGATEAFRQARQLGVEPYAGEALLRLRGGDTAGAASAIRLALDSASDVFDRARILPVAVEILIEANHLDAARNRLSELRELANTYDAPAYHASLLQAEALVALADGDAESAAGFAQRATGTWQRVGAPYEAASARVVLAAAHAALRDGQDVPEMQAALETFERIGAQADALRVRRLVAAQTAGPAQVEQLTFLFSDIVESTNLLEAIGDESWVDLVRWHDQTLRSCFECHSGQEVDHAGDGFFVAFPDAKSAVECAVSIQRDLASHRRQHGFAPRVRIGLHTTGVSKVGSSYKGKGVHEAARIAAAAGADEILASRQVIELVPEIPAGQTREVRLKGLREPAQLAPIVWR